MFLNSYVFSCICLLLCGELSAQENGLAVAQEQKGELSTLATSAAPQEPDIFSEFDDYTYSEEYDFEEDDDTHITQEDVGYVSQIQEKVTHLLTIAFVQGFTFKEYVSIRSALLYKSIQTKLNQLYSLLA